MQKNGWFHPRNENVDVENEAHRKIDDYPFTDRPHDQLKLFIFWQNWKMITEWTHSQCFQTFILRQKWQNRSDIFDTLSNYWSNLQFLISHQYSLSLFPTWSITLTKVTLLVNKIDHLELQENFNTYEGCFKSKITLLRSWEKCCQ